MTNPAPVDLAGLKTRWDALIGSGGSLALDASLVPDGAVRSFLAFLPGKTLALTGAQTTMSSAGGPLVLGVTGSLSSPWPLPALTDAPLTGLRLSATFTQKTPGGPVDSQLSVLQATLQTTGGKFLVSGSLGADGRMTVSLAAGAPAAALSLADLTALITDSRLSLEEAEGLSFFNALPLTALSAAFSFDPAAAVTLTVASDMKTDWSILPNGLFDLKGAGISLETDFEPCGDGTWNLSFSGQLRAATHVVQDMDVTLHLGRPAWEFELTPRQGAALPALSDLAGVVGGTALRDAVDGCMHDLGLGAVTLDAVRVAFDPAAKSLLYVSCDAHMTLAGGPVSLHIRLPDFAFTGGLPSAPKGSPTAPNPDGISLKDLLETRFKPSETFPDIRVAGLSVYADPSKKTLQVGVTLDTDWPMALGPGGPTLTLTSAEVSLQKSPNSLKASLSAGLSLAGFVLFLTGEYDSGNGGWSFSAEGGGDPIPLGQFLRNLTRDLGVALPDWADARPDLQINFISASYDAGTKAFRFSASVEGRGKIPLGLGECDADLRVNLTYAPDPATQKRLLTGTMEAGVMIGGALFTVSYEMDPGSKIFSGRWKESAGETVGINDLVKALNLPSSVQFPPIPSGLDLALTQAAFSYDSGSRKFTLSASSKNYGDAFFVLAMDSNNSWGCIFGVDMPKCAQLSSLPGVGGWLGAAKAFTFNKAAIMLCTGTYDNFTLPPLPSLPAAPATPTAPPSQRPAQSVAAGALLQLVPGLSVAAEATFQNAGPKEMGNLGALAGKSELVFQLALGFAQGGAELALTASLGGSVNIPTGKAPAKPLVLKDPRITIALGAAPSFQFSGGMDIPIHGAVIAATAAITVSIAGATVDVKLDSPPSAPGSAPVLPSPPGLPGISFTEFCVLMGLSFEPPAVELGFSGKFAIAGSAPGDDAFGIILQFVGDLPNPLYLAFSAKSLSLGTIAALVAKPGAGLPASDPFIDGLQATDVSFSWVDGLSPVTLPDGSQASPGLAFSANVDIPLGGEGATLQAHADLKVGPTGLSGSLQLAPLGTEDTFQVAGDGRDITRMYQQVTGIWEKVDNRNIVPRDPAPPTEKQVLVKGGGPAITMSATIPPALSATVYVTLFEKTKAQAAAHIGVSGFSFTVTFQIAEAGNIDLRCAMTDKDGLSASADLNLKLVGDVGPVHINGADCGSIHLDTRLTGDLSLTWNQEKFHLTADGSFSFQGAPPLTMPTLTVDAKMSKLADLPAKLLESIGKDASTLFAGLFKDMKAWGDAVAGGLVKGYGDAAKVLDSAFKAGVHDAAAVMKHIKEDASKVAKGLHTVYKQDSKQVAEVMKKAGFPPKDVAAGMKSAFSDITPEKMTEELIAAGFAIQDVGVAVADLFGSAVDKASDWWKKIFGGG